MVGTTVNNLLFYFERSIKVYSTLPKKKDTLNYRSSINKRIGIQPIPFYKNKTIYTETLRYPKTIGDMARKIGSKDFAAERERAILDMVNAGLTPK